MKKILIPILIAFAVLLIIAGPALARIWGSPSTFLQSLTVRGTFYAEGDVEVAGGVTVTGTFAFESTVTFEDDVTFEALAQFEDDVGFEAGVDVLGNFFVDGLAEFDSFLTVNDSAWFGEEVFMDSSLFVDGIFTSDSTATFNDSVSFGNDVVINGVLLPDAFTYQSAAELMDWELSYLVILGWLTPATTELDLSSKDHDFTYVNMVAGDRVQKGIVWSLDMYDGGDEYLSLADDADFTFDDAGGANGFSMGGWIEVIDTDSIQTIWSKWDETGGAAELREWKLSLTAAEKIRLDIYDESVPVGASLLQDAGNAEGWFFVVVTYDGDGGATALADDVIYINGVDVAETATDAGTYVGMEDLACPIYVGTMEDALGANVQYFQGDLGLMFITSEVLAADEVWLIYLSTRGLYGE